MKASRGSMWKKQNILYYQINMNIYFSFLFSELNQTGWRPRKTLNLLKISTTILLQIFIASGASTSKNPEFEELKSQSIKNPQTEILKIKHMGCFCCHWFFMRFNAIAIPFLSNVKSLHQSDHFVDTLTQVVLESSKTGLRLVKGPRTQ